MESTTNSQPSNPPLNVPEPATSSTEAMNTESMFSDKNSIIIFLLVIVILAFLGMNLLIISGNALSEVTRIFEPLTRTVLSMLGYSTGHLVNTTSKITSETVKTGVDIADGAVHSVGNLLKDASKGEMSELDRRNLEQVLTSPKCPTPSTTPEPSQTSNSIHRSISSKKGGWCFIGNDAETRGCIAINEHDKCMSGQIFPTKEACLNPNPNTQPPADF